MGIHIARRDVLRAGVAVAATSTVLSGCTTPNESADRSSTNSKVELPRYAPFGGVTPTYAGTPEGVLDAFAAYPANPITGVTDTPGSGSTISTFSDLGAAIPPPLDRNSFWQEVNRKLGVDLKMSMAPVADYASKLATILAGGDLPDVVQLNPANLARIDQLLEAKFIDLGPYLAGSAADEYPYLANIPSLSWRSTVFNGAFYGIPFNYGRPISPMMKREDILRSAGLDGTIDTVDDFLTVCKDITDPRRNRWALGYPGGTIMFFQEMYGAPNTWKEEGGKFTNIHETDENTEAILALKRMWDAGLFHPDSFAKVSQRQQWLGNGTTVFNPDSHLSWWALMQQFLPQYPDFELAAVPPLAISGGRARKFLRAPIFTMAALRKNDEGKIREILRVMNYLAAPFGTAEFLFNRFGVQGKHHTLSGTDPVLTSTGQSEVNIPLERLVKGVDAIYHPGHPDSTKRLYDYFRAVIPDGIGSASFGLYSGTDSTLGPQLEGNLAAFRNDVVQGRRTIQDWKNAVADWRKKGGDTIRQEYEDAFQKAGS